MCSKGRRRDLAIFSLKLCWPRNGAMYHYTNVVHKRWLERQKKLIWRRFTNNSPVHLTSEKMTKKTPTWKKYFNPENLNTSSDDTHKTIHILRPKWQILANRWRYSQCRRWRTNRRILFRIKRTYTYQYQVSHWYIIEMSAQSNKKYIPHTDQLRDNIWELRKMETLKYVMVVRIPQLNGNIKLRARVCMWCCNVRVRDV